MSEVPGEAAGQLPGSRPFRLGDGETVRLIDPDLMRPAHRREGRLPARDGRHFPSIYFRESDDRDGEVVACFEGEKAGGTEVILTADDYTALREALAGPDCLVTWRQAFAYIHAMRRAGAVEAAWSDADHDAIERVLAILENRGGERA